MTPDPWCRSLQSKLTASVSVSGIFLSSIFTVISPSSPLPIFYRHQVLLLSPSPFHPPLAEYQGSVPQLQVLSCKYQNVVHVEVMQFQSRVGECKNGFIILCMVL